MNSKTNSKNLILTLVGTPPIAFYRVFAELAGSAAGGLWLSQLIYWSDKGKDGDGWIYKTQLEWQEETCLTRGEQESARYSLKKLGVLEEKKGGLPQRLFYRVNFEKLQQKLLGEVATKTPKTRAGKGSPQYAKNNKLDCGKTTNLDAEKDKLECLKQQANTESTAEITTEITSERESSLSEKTDSSLIEKQGQNLLSGSTPAFKPSTDKKTGVFLKTEEDVDLLVLLVGRYGEESVKNAATEAKILKGRGWLSQITKLLEPAETRGDKLSKGKWSDFDKKDYTKGVGGAENNFSF